MGQIAKKKKGILAGPDGTGQPIFEDHGISFNGKGDEAHETFDFPGSYSGDGFNFTKTAQKPYDEVVVACLFVASTKFPETTLEVSSDGEMEDWQRGRKLYRQVLGAEPRFPDRLRKKEVDPMVDPLYNPLLAPTEEYGTEVLKNTGLIAGLAIMLAPFAYILLRRK